MVLARAIEALQSAEADYNQAIKRAEIVLKIHGCQDRLHEITSAIQKLTDAKSRHTELCQITARLVEQQKEAKLSLADKAGRVDAAQEDIRIRSVDLARERQLRQTTLEKNRADLLSEQVRNNAAVSRVQAIESTADRTRTIETAADELSKRIGELTTQHTDVVNASGDLDERERELLGISQLIRGNLARTGIEEAEKALAQIEAWREQSRQNRSAAIAIETMLDKIALPAAADLDSLKDLEHQIQIARAKMGVGLHLGLRPKRELHFSVRRDSGDLEKMAAAEGLFEAIATGEIQLDIDNIAEISLTGGEESARAEAARPQ